MGGNYELGIMNYELGEGVVLDKITRLVKLNFVVNFGASFVEKFIRGDGIGRQCYVCGGLTCAATSSLRYSKILVFCSVNSP